MGHHDSDSSDWFVMPEEAKTAMLDQALAAHGELLDKIIDKAKENADWPGTAKHSEEIFGSAVAFDAHFDPECLALMLALAANRLAYAEHHAEFVSDDYPRDAS